MPSPRDTGRYRRWWLPIALAAAAILPARAAAVPACTVSVVTGLAFGTYDVFSAAPLTSTARLRLNCPKGQSPRIMLSTGNSQRFLWRELRSASGTPLRYNVYQDAGLSVVWGDGTDGSFPLVSATGNAQLTLFGAVPPGQDVPGGGYSDLLTVTVFL